jgi:hypothetical protein
MRGSVDFNSARACDGKLRQPNRAAWNVRRISALLLGWYGALAPGGLLVLHDVSRFAVEFDVTHQGGVGRAFTEWRKAHPEVETFCLNADARTMESPHPLYKDACGVGLIYKALN